MVFNSFEYLFFLPIAFLLYWILFKKKLQHQNFLLLVLSYVFYAWWDWRFLSLILLSSFVDYYCGRFIYKSENNKTKKSWLWLSIFVNLGLLGVFKYFNFFSESFKDLFQSIGYEMNALTLDVVLPVGISFYTFQTMSYTIDVYKGQMKPTSNMLQFFSFVSFFPQLVAGPIERARNLLPQFSEPRKFKYNFVADGMRQILWGLFKKVVVADNCAVVVNEIFGNYENLNPATLAVGVIFFAFQIYGDFSGYSDIAIGTARLFGFNLMQNFASPYFSRDIAEFWRRWHISLSTWFRDYLYIPLGGSRGGKKMIVKNIFIIFVVSGFWHGANWTFVIWGALNALYITPLILLKKNRKNVDSAVTGKFFHSFKDFLSISFTFFLTCIAWIFFRSVDVGSAFGYLARLFSFQSWDIPSTDLKPFAYIFILLIVEWVQRNKLHGLSIALSPLLVRWFIYLLIILIIILFGASSDSFIYFQF